jgi:cytochrome c oxidase subunit 4
MPRRHSGIVPLLIVFAALLLLLALTVEAARHDLGRWNFVAAMAIASIKALLIVVYFMHVRDSVAITRLAVCAGFVWLAIFFTFSLADYWTRGWMADFGTPIASQ